MSKLIFEISAEGKSTFRAPAADPECENCKGSGDAIPDKFMRKSPADLPEVSEPELVRHYTRLSGMNFGVDSGFYPLGSCTMKYNPKINENIAKYEGFSKVHPMQDEDTVQGCLGLIHDLGAMLCEITGMAGFSMQPAAGAHGEFAGLLMIRAWHKSRGDEKRTRIIVPDSAHGTNPASATMAGFNVTVIKSDEMGCVDIGSLKSAIGDDVAGLMLTNPNTLGLFDENIVMISEIVHGCGGLLYYDGANANAILGITRPGDMGFDVVHLNLHKTFGTPHGGGGPGAGPIGVTEELLPFLPVPVIINKDGRYTEDYDRPLSIGRMKAFNGNFGVLVKAYAYILSHGASGLRMNSEMAVLNANYLMKLLKERYHLAYDRPCMHEFVISAKNQNAYGVTAMDIAKRLIDLGIHPPTVYFPLIVRESIMVEPTETESKSTLDAFAAAMTQIADEAASQPELLKQAPHNTPVRRLDEVKAAREPVLTYKNK